MARLRPKFTMVYEEVWEASTKTKRVVVARAKFWVDVDVYYCGRLQTHKTFEPRELQRAKEWALSFLKSN